MKKEPPIAVSSAEKWPAGERGRDARKGTLFCAQEEKEGKLYNKRCTGTDSSLISLLNVNLALHISSHTPGFSPAHPCLLPTLPLPHVPHHCPYHLCLCRGAPQGPSTPSPRCSQKQGAHLQILDIVYQVPKASFPSLAVGSAAQEEMQQ